MNEKKYITLDYEEYTEILIMIDKLNELIREIYNKANEKEQKEIYKYMRTYGKWL